MLVVFVLVPTPGSATLLLTAALFRIQKLQINVPCSRIVSESIPWLVAKGRIREAKQILERAARWNKVQLPEKYRLTIEEERMLKIIVSTQSMLKVIVSTQCMLKIIVSTQPMLKVIVSTQCMLKIIVSAQCMLKNHSVQYQYLHGHARDHS